MATKKRRLSKWHYFFGLLGFLLIGIGSWAIYELVSHGVNDILVHFGIGNFYLQMLIVISFVIIGLLVSGVSIWKAMARLIQR